MARSSLQLVDILRTTARKLNASSQYQWGHMGLCNCGFLAQEITRLRKEEIHARAMMSSGDWNEQLNDYCPTSGLPMDDMIKELLAAGFDIDDLKHLERLSSPLVLQAIPFEKRGLHKNVKPDVIFYLETWAAVLEQNLLSAIDLSSLTTTAHVLDLEKR
jgi:hypothetical protein